MATCEICAIPFTPKSNTKGRFCSRKCTNIANKVHQTAVGTQQRTYNEQLYYTNPTKCFYCTTALTYDNRHNKFCSHACAAILHNSVRDVPSSDTKLKISNTLLIYNTTLSRIYYCKTCGKIHQTKKLSKYCCKLYKPRNRRPQKPKSPNMDIVGEFSRLHLCTCKFCKEKFLSRRAFQYCPTHTNLMSNRRMQYAFRFNVYHYPQLFNIAKLKEVGWYSPGGKSGKWNPKGLSRDHIISVKDAVYNNYDVYYISHPMNCQLISHAENNQKKSKSFMTYKDLVNKVNDFDNQIVK